MNMKLYKHAVLYVAPVAEWGGLSHRLYSDGGARGDG